MRRCRRRRDPRVQLSVATVVLAAAAALLQVEVRVPRAAKPTIDGRLDAAEWSASVREESKGRLQVRLQHDGESLFIGVTSPGAGFVSVCLADGDAIRVLHASAALGAVNYTRDGGDWTPDREAFVYGMRNTAFTSAALAERRAYLAEHGWLASTARMGDGRNQELQIALTRVPATARLAVAYYLTSDQGSVVAWPDSMSATDGCTELQLVRGFVPPRLRFDPRRWAALHLGS